MQRAARAASKSSSTILSAAPRWVRSAAPGSSAASPGSTRSARCSRPTSGRSTPGTAPVFEASHPFLLFDYFRVPYRTDEDAESSLANLSAEHPLRQCGELRSSPASGGGRSGSLHWPLGPDLARGELGSAGIYYLDRVPLCGHFVPDRVAADWLAAAGGSWAPTISVHDAAGRRHASVW